MHTKDKVQLASNLPLLGMYLACGLAWWTGVSKMALIACGLLYVVRMFALTAGYHRYFSHNSYKTGRAFQFVLAWLGCCAVQKGPLWWAGHHRWHHGHSDTEADLHSPIRRGFWWSQIGWVLSSNYTATNWPWVRNLSGFPELRFLNRFHLLPPATLAMALWVLGTLTEHHAAHQGPTGMQMVIWGFFISTVLLHHASFTVNSLGHVYGTRRFPTRDNSRNNFWIALITLGEGWHNNHHYAPSSERQGFFWWEIDCTHYVLTVLLWLGIIWDLQTPPRGVLQRTERSQRRASTKGVWSVESGVLSLNLPVSDSRLRTADSRLLSGSAENGFHFWRKGMSKPALIDTNAIIAPADVEMSVRTIVAQVLERSVEEIPPESDLENDLGLDSLGLIKVSVAIEEQFDVVILTADSPEFTLHTVADLAAFIANRTIDSEQEDGNASNASR
jgi:stearoyl-CoA desaturase (delta-9 desaturase)